MIAQSQSGTGKTAAFVLTMLSRVVVESPWPQVCLKIFLSTASYFLTLLFALAWICRMYF